MGPIWDTSGLHMGPIWDISGLSPDVSQMGPMWDPCGIYLGYSPDISQMGPIWDPSGLSGPQIAHQIPYGSHVAPRSCAGWVLGLPTFLRPWGFNVKAGLEILPSGFLRVWPIHLHFLSVMSSCTGRCFVLLHNSWLEILSGQ